MPELLFELAFLVGGDIIQKEHDQHSYAEGRQRRAEQEEAKVEQGLGKVDRVPDPGENATVDNHRRLPDLLEDGPEPRARHVDGERQQRNGRGNADVQRRSVRTRDRILKAAEELFSKRGYYKTNSKQIALRATVAVGSFYAYFRDKKAVLIDLLEYHNKKVFDSLDLFKDSADLDSGNPRQFFIAMIENVLQAHEHLPDFHRDNSFSIYSHPEAKKLDNRFKQAAIEKTMELFEFFGDRLRISDPEAAADSAVDGVFMIQSHEIPH